MFEKIICWVFDHRWTLPYGLASSHRLCKRCKKQEELGQLVPDSYFELFTDYSHPFILDAWRSQLPAKVKKNDEKG